jgi:hypothetical protein
LSWRNEILTAIPYLSPVGVKSHRGRGVSLRETPELNTLCVFSRVEPARRQFFPHTISYNKK